MSDKKKSQLGMNPSTAMHRLRKMLLFDMAQRLGYDVCFHCGYHIIKIDEFSVEHKIAWLDSEDPVGMFFDLDNIAFSHVSCNAAAGRRPHAAVVSDGNSWCSRCQTERPTEEFFLCNGKPDRECKECHRLRLALPGRRQGQYKRTGK